MNHVKQRTHKASHDTDLPFLQKVKWKLGPLRSNGFRYNTVISHFHDYEGQGMKALLSKTCAALQIKSFVQLFWARPMVTKLTTKFLKNTRFAGSKWCSFPFCMGLNIWLTYGPSEWPLALFTGAQQIALPFKNRIGILLLLPLPISVLNQGF